MEVPSSSSSITQQKHKDDKDDMEDGRIVGPFGILPAHLFLVASLPLCIGAYTGYRRQVQQAEQEAKEAAARKAAGKAPRPLRLSADGRVLGARALGVATLLSLGSFGILTAATLYAGGFRSFQEVRAWGRKRRMEWEEWSDVEWSKNDPDKIATRNMTEEEEMDYVYQKYLTDDIIIKNKQNENSKQS